MDFDLGDPLRWRESLPARQPASSEAAAGAVAGLTGGLVAWGVAMALLPEGEGGLRPLRLVASTLFGPSAVAPGNVVPPAIVGALLVGFAAIAYGLVFVSILRPAAPPRRAIAVGAIYGGSSTSRPGWAWCTCSTRCSTRRGRAGAGWCWRSTCSTGPPWGSWCPYLRKILP